MGEDLRKSPCLGCVDRVFGCFADCGRYKAWRKKTDDIKKKIKEGSRRESLVSDYAAESAMRVKKRQGRK